MKRYQGRGKSALVVDGADIVIEHHISSVPDLRVEQRRVTAVHFEAATRFTAGIITIAVDGADLVVPTGTDAGADPFTVLFKHKANDAFIGVRAWLEQLAAENAG